MKIRKSQKFFACIIVLAFIVLTGCRTNKTIVNNGNSTKDWEFSTAINEILQNQLQYKTISAKGNIEIKGGSAGKKTTAYYKIIKDSVMQASIRMPIVGGELIRINFTPDSVVFIDRIHGRYASEKLSDSKFMKSTDLNYYNLQSLLTNGLFLPGIKNVEANNYSKFKMSSMTDVLMLQTTGKPNLIFNFAVGAQEKIISVLVTKKDFDATMQFTYSDFVREKDQVYPTVLDASLSWGKHNMGVTISYSNLEIDKPNMEIDTTIPKKYNQVSFETLIEPYIKK